MERTLKVLIVEDSPMDATLLIRELGLGAYTIDSCVVQNKLEFELQLETKDWDCIISDYRLPNFSALEALRILQESGKDIPFVIVSGVVGEEIAVEAMRKGAHDFFLKGKFMRLIPALEREISEGMNRKARVSAEAKMKDLVLQLENEKSLRENFVIGLSHDLRTPLTASRLALQILQKKIETDPLKKSCDRIIFGIDRIDRMIQDLLNANRLKSGEQLPTHLEPYILNDLILNVFEEMVLNHGNRFSFTSERDEIVFWDKEAIRRILENLLGNAVKYGKKDSTISVGLRVNESNVEISVHNLGTPILVEEQSKLFDSYSRTASAQVGGQEGWGIGLALVRGLAEAHGGYIRVKSSEIEGTTFVVSIPQDKRVNELTVSLY